MVHRKQQSKIHMVIKILQFNIVIIIIIIIKYYIFIVLQKVYHEFHHQLVDVLSDRDTHHSIVSKLHTRAVISQEVMVAQMSSTGGSDRGSSLLTVLDLEDKPHKLRELITAMMEEENMRPLAEEMTAMLNKTDQGMGLAFHPLNIIFLTQMKIHLHNIVRLVRQHIIINYALYIVNFSSGTRAGSSDSSTEH